MQSQTLLTESTERLDKFLTQHIQSSRNQIENLIKNGFVSLDGKPATKPGIKLKPGQTIQIIFPEKSESEHVNVDFDVEILHEDADILVINKPAHLTVHPAPSVKEATLVDWLKSKDVSLSTLSGEERHGIVHRLDKETSGVMVVAKNNQAHAILSEQLQNRTMGRYYLALIDLPLKENQIIEKPLARNHKNRLKIGIVEEGRYAKSAFAKLALPPHKKTELIAAKLFTGRTHQIRAHLAAINRHILGDSLYGFKSGKDKIPRIYLHAYILYLNHPSDRKKRHFMAPIPQDMQNYLNTHFEDIYEKVDPKYILSAFDSFC